jgi:YHS domain-containing protein
MKFFFLRILLPLLLFLIVRSVIRTLFAKGSSVPERAERPADVAAGGELKKDPVCGTYVSAASSLREKVAGETVYFCSAECRAKYLS